MACLALLAVYVGLALLNDPGGYLGTDTGAKVATLRSMERNGGLDPDVGYWAERWDPEGTFHPLFDTQHIGRRWVIVTTLPALVVGYPLYRLGGYRLTLLVPMMGSVLAALAARALASRVAAGRGWIAFWTVGLASPFVVYALDFWEHSLGVALMAWGTVLLLDVLEQRSWRRAFPAGVLFGLAATMRTEALVYAFVASAVVGTVHLVRRRDVIALVPIGIAVLAGFALSMAGNVLLEDQILGGALRTTRTATTASGSIAGGAAPTEYSRLEEAVATAVALQPAAEAASYVVGLALLGLLAYAAARALGEGAGGPAAVAFAGAAALYLLRFSEGLGFVPGLVAATPLAAVGLLRRARSPAAPVVLAVAVLALPVVWRFQILGGAGPQWGGRYILTTALLLGTLGAVTLPELARWSRVGFVALAVAVTAFGVAWLNVRSHEIARTAAVLDQRPEPVIVSRVAHLAREFGARYGDKRWLTVIARRDAPGAARVLRRAGVERFALVQLRRERVPFPGYRSTSVDRVRFFSDIELQLTTYRLEP